MCWQREGKGSQRGALLRNRLWDPGEDETGAIPESGVACRGFLSREWMCDGMME